MSKDELTSEELRAVRKITDQDKQSSARHRATEPPTQALNHPPKFSLPVVITICGIVFAAGTTVGLLQTQINENSEWRKRAIVLWEKQQLFNQKIELTKRDK